MTGEYKLLDRNLLSSWAVHHIGAFTHSAELRGVDYFDITELQRAYMQLYFCSLEADIIHFVH